jgi:transcriptional regulator with XRE-family HTH domain/DNA polymerase III delta prime subunit
MHEKNIKLSEARTRKKRAQSEGAEKNTKLSEARARKKWTQSEVAEKIGTTQVNVNRWEQGKNRPSPYYRQALVNLFGLSEEELGLTSEAGPTIPAKSEVREAERPSETTLPPRDQDRQSMIQRVSNLWISGVLDHSLFQGRLIHLHLQEQPDAVANPWAEAVQESILPSHAIDEKKSIIDIYDHASGALLLLGESGAGKTTTLLCLTRELLERAKADETHPLPAVFNLSSWAERRLSIPAWMVEELNRKYQVPHKLAQTWVEANQVLPLLDGLDEVTESCRVDCIQTLNEYRKEHGFLPMVVCSRKVGYLALLTRLALNNAIAIEPLTEKQIDEYITSGGKPFRDVKTAFQNDPSLKELASTPLMLSIITRAFQNSSLSPLASVQDPRERRRLIFEKYVEVVLRRRGPKKQYQPEQVVHWLAWLARHMQNHNQTEFHLERLQPDWLPDDRTRLRYRNTITRLVFGINCCVVAALFACFRGDSAPTKPGLFFWLGAGGKGNEILEWMRPGLAPGLAGAGSLDLLMIVPGQSHLNFEPLKLHFESLKL